MHYPSPLGGDFSHLELKNKISTDIIKVVIRVLNYQWAAK